MKGNMKIIAILSFAVLLIAYVPFARADQSRVVRLRDVEGNVTLHPSDNQRAEEATVNTPVLDGDELETQEGRAELAFRNGVVVRAGDDSRIRIDSAYNPMRIELLQGTLFVDSHMVDTFRDTLEVLAGDAQVYLIDEGNMRVDLGTEGSIRVTSIQGEAEVRANGRRVLVENGERTYIDPGKAPEQAEAFNGQSDDLDQWNQSRIEQYADRGYNNDNNDNSDRYLDDNVHYDGSDLDQYGDWRAYGSYGHVWVPNEGADWRPYYDGRWSYCNGGWFWVSYEPWGWAPYHYGRWGWGLDIGWYWIPGDVFAPAWVSWFDYGDYIGWCPLNFYNRPVFIFNYYNGINNFNNLRPVFKQRTLDAGNSWTFVKKDVLGANHLKGVAAPPSEVRKIRIDENKVSRAPQSQLVGFVIPKTIQSRGFVNDKRILKKPEDIHNPVGVDHREEQFGRGRGDVHGTDKRPVVAGGGSPAVHKQHNDEQFGRPSGFGNPYRLPGNDRDKESPIRIERNGNDRNPYGNRNMQFLRENNMREKQNPPSMSPYYRGRDFRSRDNNNDNREMDPMLWYRQQLQRRGNSDDNRDISPRYGEEARRMFEGFDQNRNHRDAGPINEGPRGPQPENRIERMPPPPHDYGRPAPQPQQQQHRENQNHGNNGNHGKPEHH